MRRIAKSSAINPNYDQVGGSRCVRYHDDKLKHIQWLASVAADCAQMAQQADESHAEQYALIAEAANYEIQKMGKFPVTQAQWEAVMGETPSKCQGAEPVVMVSCPTGGSGAGIPDFRAARYGL